MLSPVRNYARNTCHATFPTAAWEFFWRIKMSLRVGDLWEEVGRRCEKVEEGEWGQEGKGGGANRALEKAGTAKMKGALLRQVEDVARNQRSNHGPKE